MIRQTKITLRPSLNERLRLETSKRFRTSHKLIIIYQIMNVLLISQDMMNEIEKINIWGVIEIDVRVLDLRQQQLSKVNFFFLIARAPSSCMRCRIRFFTSAPKIQFVVKISYRVMYTGQMSLNPNSSHLLQRPPVRIATEWSWSISLQFSGFPSIFVLKIN